MKLVINVLQMADVHDIVVIVMFAKENSISIASAQIYYFVIKPMEHHHIRQILQFVSIMI